MKICDCSGTSKHNEWCMGCDEMIFPKLIKREDWEGYSMKDIKKFFGDSPLMSKFNNWFSGKTGVIDRKKGYCVYKWDFHLFLDYIGLSVGGVK